MSARIMAEVKNAKALFWKNEKINRFKEITQEPYKNITKYPVKTVGKFTFPKRFVKKTTGSVKIKIKAKRISSAKYFDKTFCVIDIGKLSKVSFFPFHTFIERVGTIIMQI